MLSRTLRGAAWLVILLAIVDPAVPLTSRQLPRIAVLPQAPPDVVGRVVSALERALAGSVSVEQGPVTDPEAFVLVADRYPDAPMPAGAPVHVVAAGEGRTSSLSITRVVLPALSFLRLPVGVAVHVERREGAAAARTSVRLLRDGVTVGEGEIRWRAGQRASQAMLTFVPTSPGVTALRVEAADPSGRALSDALTDVRDTRFPVTVTSSRPSWAVSFAAGALEDDDRLSVTTRIGTTPGREVRSENPENSTGTNFSFRHMAKTEIRPGRILVVGGDRWDEVTALRRVAERGGVVVLVPDRTVPPAVRELAGIGTLREHVTPRPAQASIGLRASEWLLASGLNPASATRGVLTVNGHDYPLVVDTPAGEGRMVLVTALDAWRFRADAAYSRFWRALIVELAARQAAAMQRLSVVPGVVRPGDSLSIAYEAPPELAVDTVAARAVSGNGGSRAITLVRHSGSRFIGRLLAPASEGTHRIEIDRPLGEPSASAPFVVARDASQTRSTNTRALRVLATAHRGTFVDGADVSALARTLRDTLPLRDERVRARPMRWWGWGAIVAALLGADWWTRRRKGLR